MSLEIQKEEKIVEANRVWPFYEATGIPILPRKVRCVGKERCPAIKLKGKCNPRSRHHLLFEREDFISRGDPYNELVNNSLLIVKMAECRHNYFESGNTMYSIHANYDRAHIPERAVAQEFIDESEVLISALSHANDLAGMRNLLGMLHNHPERITSTEYIDEVSRKLHVATNMMYSDFDMFPYFSVIPSRVVMKAANDIMHRRAEIREVFTGEPRDDLAPIRDAAVDVGLALAA